MRIAILLIAAGVSLLPSTAATPSDDLLDRVPTDDPGIAYCGGEVRVGESCGSEPPPPPCIFCRQPKDPSDLFP